MSNPEHPLIVIGHKNPDTDSICSAIAYAHFKSNIQHIPAIPYRAGNLNPQTSFVLSRFDMPSPELLTDVYPKIADIMIKAKDLICLSEDDTLGKAQETIINNRFSFLPVVGADGRCAGKITALRIAGMLRDIAHFFHGRDLSFDFDRFINSVDGRMPAENTLSGSFAGRLFVSALTDNSAPVDPGSTALLACRDGEEVRAAIRKKAELVVLCGGNDCSRETIDSANKSGTCLVISTLDILATAMCIVMEMPLADFIDRQHTTFYYYDRVRDVQKEMGRHNEGGFIVLDDDGIMQGIITRVSFLDRNRFQIVMVDHNEFSQGVAGIEEAEIAEIIDHHRLGNRHSDVPITFINKVVGSTSTIVADLYQSHGSTPPPKIAAMMLSAVLSDTVMLKSPTATRLDRDIAKWLAAHAGLDIESFGTEIFPAGSAVEGLDPGQIIEQDMKIYVEGDWKFSISQIEIVGFNVFYGMKGPVMEKLAGFMTREGCRFSCLMVTDITKESSLLLFSGEKKVAAAITYPQVENNIFEMRAVLSRKKQVVPYLLDLLRRL